MQVLWTEGIYLSPQHFQLWERESKAEAWLRHRISSTHSAVVLSVDLLCSNGQVTLRAFQGVLPDGSPASVPGMHSAPAARQLPSGSDTSRRGVWLAMPEEHSSLTNLAGQGVLHPARLQASKVRVQDVYGESEVAEIDVGIPQLRLLYDGESFDGLVAIKLGEIGRDGDGVWTLSAAYIPVCLRCDSSPVLMGLLRDLSDRLSARLASLQPRRELALATEGFGDGLKVMWVSMILSQGLAQLRHALHLGGLSPQEVHGELAKLASQLGVFHSAPLPSSLPLFRSERIYDSFRELITTIVTLMDISFPTGFQCLDFTLRDKHTRVCKLDGVGDMETQQLYLFVRGLSATGATLKDLLGVVKVASDDQIDNLVVHGLSGIELQPTDAGQARLPDHADGFYLRLRATGLRWEKLVETRSLAAWLPDRFSSVEAAIYIVT